MKLRLSVLVGLCLLLTYPATSQAQLNGHNTRGDYGLMSGTQLPVGNYALGLYYDYSADTLRDSNGDPRPALSDGGSVDVTFLAGAFDCSAAIMDSVSLAPG
jgi:hypothetical protein